jgi:hypothetical protein
LLIPRSTIFACPITLFTDEWTIDQKIDMGEDIVDGWKFSLNQLLDRKSGIDDCVNTVMLESGYKLGNGFRLIEWLPS